MRFIYGSFSHQTELFQFFTACKTNCRQKRKQILTFNVIDILTVRSIYASVKFDDKAERGKNIDSRL